MRRCPAAGRPAGLTTALTGTLLIASTYGMARFGVGLYGPRIEAQHPALAGMVGLAAGAQFVSYALAAVLAALLVDRRPRTGLVLAGCSATLGCLGIAAASDPVLFVAAVFVAGMGGGFASPALVRLVDAVVSDEASSAAQSLVNAGTAVGVVGAGLIAFIAARVGPAWLLMAGLCAAAALATLGSVRGLALTEPPVHPARSSGPGDGWVALGVPAVSALVTGAGSALMWTLGPSLTISSGTVGFDQVGWLWVALGLGGLGGLLTSAFSDRLGIRGAWGAFSALLTVASAMLSVSVTVHSSWAAYGAMAVFGAGYMCMSGTLILWARAVRPSRAGAATSTMFVALAVGQAIGSVGFGSVRDRLTPGVLAVAAAGLCALGGAVGVLHRPGSSGPRGRGTATVTWPSRSASARASSGR